MRLLQEYEYGHLFQKHFKVECDFFEFCDRFFYFWRKRIEKCYPGLSKSLTPSVDFQLSHSRSQKMHKFGQHVLLAAESAFWFFFTKQKQNTKTRHGLKYVLKGFRSTRPNRTMSPCQQDTINQIPASDLCYFVMEAKGSLLIKVVCIRLRRTTEQITYF